MKGKPAAKKRKPPRKAAVKKPPFSAATIPAAAAFFGVSVVTMNTWLRKSGIRKSGDGYPLDEIARWYINRTATNQVDDVLAAGKRELQVEDLRKRRRINAEAEGELVHKTLIAAVLRQVLAGARSRFESTPAEIASLLPVEIRDDLLVSITNAVERICHSFATDGRDLIENLGNDE